MNLLELSLRLAAHPELASLLTYDKLIQFSDIVHWLREEIAVIQRPEASTTPTSLPTNVCGFLSAVFSLSQEDITGLWQLLGDVFWRNAVPGEVGKERAQALVPLFLKHGAAHKLCFYNLRPPTRVCLDRGCSKKRVRVVDGEYEIREAELAEPRSFDAVVFSRDLGPLPAQVISLYCRGCHTRYYHNYFVHEGASTRTYYIDSVPPFIHINLHFLVSVEVCEMFATLMNVSWTSATNCAEFYNTSCIKEALSEHLPYRWRFTHELDAEQVWEAFFTYSLLLDHHERDASLELPHNAPTHAERLRPALKTRNLRMAGPGQEQWSHACNLCCSVSTGDDGQPYAVRSVVTDGITIGHPCCGVQDCKEPIVRTKGARYCASHASKECECSILGCENPAEDKFKSCRIPSHRALDERYHAQNTAMFQLRGRLERLSTAQRGKNILPETLSMPPITVETATTTATTSPAPILPVQSPDVSEIDSDLVMQADEVECEVKSPEGNQQIKALFGRRRTHNDELCVASCGVILGRATFYGSEAVNGVITFWRRLFPTRASLPPVLWHDQNCRVWAVIENADEDTRAFFDGRALPVDVFHFKCKHKDTDIVCSTHCNPYIWPELRTDDDKWRFNSSAAEQTNVWYGKFQAIVREMDVDRYNFFLDETCKRRNHRTIRRLAKQGHCPYVIPRETLLHVD